MKQVLLFGTFDPLHEGHRQLFAQSKRFGKHLTVVVASDAQLTTAKRRHPLYSQDERQQAVIADPNVDLALIGASQSNDYSLLKKLTFDVLVLGFDQEPLEAAMVRQRLDKSNHRSTVFVRLPPYRRAENNSSRLRMQYT